MFQRRIGFILLLVFCATGALFGATAHVSLNEDHLYLDGEKVPYLFGAEVQYFRARGGSGRNVPAEKVQKLWEKLVDRLVEAHMNAVELYIPWDFHEPVEGVFDFDGTLDQDHDGKPDYPSRNLRGFLNLLVSRGFQRILIRPGPYINAEWGPTGFGAVPLWFLNNYPQALAGTQTPGKVRTASFNHPIFRQHVTQWFHALYDQVLKDFIGPGKPIFLLQLDNETNYFWDSVYERDRSAGAIERYRAFLRRNYGDSIEALNQTYQSSFGDFDAVTPPDNALDTRVTGSAWHADWYFFHDLELRSYYHFLRATWESLGVREPDVLFTSCDSFNAPDHGLLPRLDFREDGKLTLTTMNVYPKTFGPQSLSTLNEPMKAAHDATLVGASHRQFYGAAGNWVMSTETVGGWFPDQSEVSLATREHTYGSLLGSGVKAMMIYYFHEGWNWTGKEGADTELKFDAPLDKDMNPRPAFGLLEQFGASLEAGLGELAEDSTGNFASVLIAHDTAGQYPLPGLPDALKNASSESAALFGFFREAGFLPEVGYLDRMSPKELQKFRVVVWSPPGYSSQAAKEKLENYLSAGGTVISIGKTPIRKKGTGQVIPFETSPASGWDSDDYLRLTDAKARLEQMTAVLRTAGLFPQLEIKAADDQPFIHGWVRKTDGGKTSLLFTENFLRKKRSALVRFAKDSLDPKASYHLFRRFGPEGGLDLGTKTFQALTSQGVTLPVTSDGIDVWVVQPQ